MPVGARVPAALDGEVVALLPDFIATTLVVRHGAHRREGAGGGHARTLHTIFGHVEATVAAGERVREGATCAHVAANAKTSAPPHLHLSVAWLDERVAPDELSWQMLGSSLLVTLVRPIDLVPAAAETTTARCTGTSTTATTACAPASEDCVL